MLWGVAHRLISQNNGKSMKFLVTGVAGFIGFHIAKRLLQDGHNVYGIDNLNDYYDVNLKLARLEILKNWSQFDFTRLNIADADAMAGLFSAEHFQRVIHLAAQAGVRYSLENPYSYAQANLVGQVNVLECCRQHSVEHLLYASSSSVYGLNTTLPFSVKDNADHPVSLYAASKKASELMAHSYSHLFQLPTTGMRFFTVYGPWGRPDMALFKFTRAIMSGQSIDVYNQGNMRRDFTYIDDIVEMVIRLQQIIPQPDKTWCARRGTPADSCAPYRIYNIGNSQPVALMDYILALENALGKQAKKNLLPLQPGDVQETWADMEDLYQLTGFIPQTPLQTGVKHFVDWYHSFYDE